MQVLPLAKQSEQFVLANAVQIRDTANHYFPGNTSGYGNTVAQSVSGYLEKGILVYNGTDQAVNINIHLELMSIPQNTTTRVIVVNNDSVAAGGTKWYGTGSYATLKDPLPYLIVQANATIAPTTGAVSIYLQGAPR